MDTPTADPPAPALDWATAEPLHRGVRAEAQAVLDAVGLTDLTLGLAPEPACDPDAADLLSERHRSILDFERQWWRQAGAKEQAIRDTFEMSPTRYYQALNAVLDLPEALQYDSVLVNRLQRLRSSSPRGRRLR